MLAQWSARHEKKAIVGGFLGDTGSMTVITCHTPMGTYAQMQKYLDLLKLWRRAWSEAGFTPVVLDGSKRQAGASEESRLRAAFDRSETVNHRDYEWHCYRRWLLLKDYAANFATPLLMVDGDVFPNPSQKKHPFFWNPAAEWSGRFHVLDAGGNPCAVLANHGATYDWILLLRERIPTLRIDYKGKPHVSDMIVAQHAYFPPANPLCAAWEDRRDLPLIHVSTDSVIKEGFRAEDKSAFVSSRIGTFKRPASK